jgi:hypothetical protein
MDDNSSFREVWTGIAGAFAEWLFALLPLVVVAVIVMLYLGELPSWLESPEWAFGASILAGQALVRFVAGAARAGNLSSERVALYASALSVILVVPANVVLALVILSEEVGDGHASSPLVIAQVVLFCLASVMFVFLGTLAHLLTRRDVVSDGNVASEDQP